MTINREELAWAAGLFEGEGCITGQYNGRFYYPKLVLASTDFDVVSRFQAAVGGVGNITFQSRRQGWKEIAVWQVSRFEHWQAVIALMWPWLETRRRARIKEVMQLAKDSWALAS